VPGPVLGLEYHLSGAHACPIHGVDASKEDAQAAFAATWRTHAHALCSGGTIKNRAEP
jgi:hypothetical protein